LTQKQNIIAEKINTKPVFPERQRENELNPKSKESKTVYTLPPLMDG